MMRPTRPISVLATATLLAFGLPGPHATAGPPLICHPVEIGDAAGRVPSSLSATKGETGAGKRSASVLAETLAFLDSERSALVHMETLRRATLSVGHDRDGALELAAALMARALDAAAAAQPPSTPPSTPASTPGSEAAIRWLDAGYFLACLAENGARLDLPGGTAAGVTGYGWVKRAVALRPDDAEIQFAAAMVTVMSGIPDHAEHLAKARALAGDGTLVARNLSQRAPFMGGRAPAQRG